MIQVLALWCCWASESGVFVCSYAWRHKKNAHLRLRSEVSATRSSLAVCLELAGRATSEFPSLAAVDERQVHTGSFGEKGPIGAARLAVI